MVETLVVRASLGLERFRQDPEQPLDTTISEESTC